MCKWRFSMFLQFAAVGFAIAIASVPASIPAVEGPASDPVERAEGVAAEIRGANLLEGMARLRYIRELRPWMPVRESVRILEDLEPVSGSPLLEFRRRLALRRLYLDLPNFRDRAADDFEEAMGCLTRWRIVGPFENSSKEAFTARLPPERGKKGPYTGKNGGAIQWRSGEPFRGTCRMLFGRAIEPSTRSVLLASSEVTVPARRRAYLAVGSSGPFEIWINGEPVAKRSESLGFVRDHALWPISLNPGVNRIVVKIASANRGQMEFAARLLDRRRRPLDGVKQREASEARELGRTGDIRDGAPEGPKRLLRNFDWRESSNAKRAWMIYLWRMAESLHPGRPWEDRAGALFEDGIGDLGSLEIDLAVEALSERERERSVLEEAVERFDADPWIALKLLAEYRKSAYDRDRFEELDFVEEIRASSPDFVPGIIAEARWYSDRDLSEKARSILENQKPDRWEEIPRYLERLVAVNELHDRGVRVRNLYRLWTATKYHCPEHIIRHREALLRNGETRGALEIVRSRRKRCPFDSQLFVEESRLLRALDRGDEALNLLKRGIEFVPTSVDLHREYIDLLIEQNRRERAIEALEEAIDRRPAEQSFREELKFLTDERRTFFEPWIERDFESMSTEEAPGSHPFDTLLDQQIVQIESNGLTSTFTQRIRRPNTSVGVDKSRHIRIPYRRGDERVELLEVRSVQSDGSESTEYETWTTRSNAPTIYNDTRHLNVRVSDVEVGDLVEFRYEIREIPNENFRGDYFGDFRYIEGPRPIRTRRYVVLYPANWSLYFRPPSHDYREIETRDIGRPNYRAKGFELQDLEPVEAESGQPGRAEVYDYIAVSNRESYDAIAEWWWNLVEDQLVVDDRIRETVDELVDPDDSTRRRVESIHRYLAETTRYLHLGLGIHGWKPYQTTTVFRNQYGDCKDKSALLKVMLREAGIDSRLVLVRTRDLGRVDSYPANMHVFNHAVLYIPALDLYLDGTSKYHGVGELPQMDQGAQGLIVRENGTGKLVTIPREGPGDNLIEYDFEIELDPEGQTDLRGSIRAEGQHGVRYRRRVESARSSRELLNRELSSLFPGLSVREGRAENLSRIGEPVQFEFEAGAADVIRTRGDRKFVYPMGFAPDLESRYASRSERSRDLSLDFPFTHRATVRFEIPDRYEFAELPNAVEHDGKFGSYSLEYRRDEEGVLEVGIEFRLAVQRVESENYSEFKEFIERLDENLQRKIMIE